MAPVYPQGRGLSTVFLDSGEKSWYVLRKKRGFAPERMKHMNIAVVTGASSGMGRQFAIQLSRAEKFDEMWVIARREAALENLRDQVSCPLRPVCLDLTDPRSFEAYQALLEREKPRVRVLVNAAGFGKFGEAMDIPLSDSFAMVDLNCKALMAMTQLTVPYMSAGDRIVELDSLSAFQPVPYITVYGATKAFVLSYSRALNQELKPRGIRVMAVSPGWVRTEFFQRAETTNAEKKVQYYDRTYSAEEVVRTALHDLYRTQKDVSIHGYPVRRQVRLVKLLPHSLVMKIWLNQQKKSKPVPQEN